MNNAFPGNYNGLDYMLYFNMYTLLFSGTIGTEELTEEHVNIYPNPFRDKITLDITTPANYEIFGIDGRIVLSGGPVEKQSIGMSEFLPGIYIIRISDNNNNVTTRKIIKQPY